MLNGCYEVPSGNWKVGQISFSHYRDASVRGDMFKPPKCVILLSGTGSYVLRKAGWVCIWREIQLCLSSARVCMSFVSEGSHGRCLNGPCCDLFEYTSSKVSWIHEGSRLMRWWSQQRSASRRFQRSGGAVVRWRGKEPHAVGPRPLFGCAAQSKRNFPCAAYTRSIRSPFTRQRLNSIIC